MEADTEEADNQDTSTTKNSTSGSIVENRGRLKKRTQNRCSSSSSDKSGTWVQRKKAVKEQEARTVQSCQIKRGRQEPNNKTGVILKPTEEQEVQFFSNSIAIYRLLNNYHWGFRNCKLHKKFAEKDIE